MSKTWVAQAIGLSATDQKVNSTWKGTKFSEGKSELGLMIGKQGSQRRKHCFLLDRLGLEKQLLQGPSQKIWGGM